MKKNPESVYFHGPSVIRCRIKPWVSWLLAAVGFGFGCWVLRLDWTFEWEFIRFLFCRNIDKAFRSGGGDQDIGFGPHILFVCFTKTKYTFCFRFWFVFFFFVKKKCTFFVFGNKKFTL